MLQLALRAGATWLDCVPCLELPKAEIQRPGVCILGIGTRCGTSRIASCNFLRQAGIEWKILMLLKMPYHWICHFWAHRASTRWCFEADWIELYRNHVWNRPRCEPTRKAGVEGTASAAEWQQTLSKFGLSFQFIEANRILNDMFSVTFIGTIWNNDNFSWGHLQFFRISLFPHYHKCLWVKLNQTKFQCCLGFARYAGTAIHIQDQLLQISIFKSKQLSKFHRKN